MLGFLERTITSRSVWKDLASRTGKSIGSSAQQTLIFLNNKIVNWIQTLFFSLLLLAL